MPTSKQETQRQAILHLWNNGICEAKEINKRTNIYPFLLSMII